MSASIKSHENYIPRPGLTEEDLQEFFSPQLMRRMGLSTGRSDAADTAIFLRQLTDVIVPTFDIKYVDNMARKLIPVDTSVQSGANSLVWRQFDKMGQAKIVDSYSDDFPNVEILGKEYQTRIVSLGASFQYSFQDLRAAAMANLPLEGRKALAARFAVERLLETIACTGMTGANGTYLTNASDTMPIYGLSNFPNIGATVGHGSIGAGYTDQNWVGGSVSVTSILADINAMVQQIFNVSGGIHKPNTLVLPTAVYSYLATTARSPTFTDDSILQYILKQVPFLDSIEFWPFLDLAGKKQDTTTAGPRVMMYEKKPENMSLVIPQDFEMFAPEKEGGVFKVMTHMRTAGVVVHYPKSIAYLDGTTG